jgi:fructose-1,6-bisphosphatase
MNPEVKLKVQNAINEIVIHMDRAKIEGEAIADIIKTLKAEVDINPKVIRKAAQAVHMGNLGETNAELEETQELFDSIMGA